MEKPEYIFLLLFIFVIVFMFFGGINDWFANALHREYFGTSILP